MPWWLSLSIAATPIAYTIVFRLTRRYLEGLPRQYVAHNGRYFIHSTVKNTDRWQGVGISLATGLINLFTITVPVDRSSAHELIGLTISVLVTVYWFRQPSRRAVWRAYSLPD